jgi:uncharacterized protein
MNSEDRGAIEALFSRLGDARRQGSPRDREAENLIGEQIAAQPAAPYYMAQTVIVQQQALEAAQARIEELEQGGQRQGGGGFLGGLFGGGGQRPAVQGGVGPWGQAPGGAMGGGGFLAGAAQTAVGVAGGVVLGNMLGDLFSPDEAHAQGLADTDGGDAAGDHDGISDHAVDDLGGIGDDW